MSSLIRFQLFLKLKFSKSFSRSYRFLIAGIYLIGFLIWGEVHPFSSYPMYNSFPNWSYTFYFTDEHDNLIPSSEFNLSTGDINHKFYAICENDKINYGNGIETEAELSRVGQKLTKMVVQSNINNTHSTIRLHRVYFKYEGLKIVKNDTVIYEKHF